MDTHELLKSILLDYNSRYHDKNPELTSMDRTGSFIYQYFLACKKAEIAKFTERKSDFIKGAAALVKGMTIEKSADLERLSDKSVSIRDNYLLLAISQNAFEAGWISESELRGVILKTRKIKKAPPVLFEKGSEEYNAAWERCLRILLHKTICDFFNSKGFIVNGSGANRSGKSSTKARDPDDRKERDLVHMSQEYIKYRQKLKKQNCPPETNPRTERFTNRAAAPAEVFKEKAKRLLRAITDDKGNEKSYKKDIIPIYFDRRIGAGIYLIGEDCFEPSVLMQSDFARGSVCIPCLVSFFMGMANGHGQYIYIDKQENDSSPIKAGFEMDVEIFPTVDMAFSALESKNKDSYFDMQFSLQNQSVAPSGIPNEFRNIME